MKRAVRFSPALITFLVLASIGCSTSSSSSQDSRSAKDTAPLDGLVTDPVVQEISITDLATKINQTDVASVTVAPNSSYMAIGRLSGEVELWDLSTGELKLAVDGTRSLDASCVADYSSFFIVSYFYDGGDYFATTLGGGQECTSSASVALWSIADGSLLQLLTDVGGQSIEDLAISRDGAIVSAVVHCCGGSDWVSIWSSSSGERLTSLDEVDTYSFLNFIFYEIDAVPGGFLVSASIYDDICSDGACSQCLDEFCEDVFQYSFISTEVANTEFEFTEHHFLSIAPPGAAGQLVSPNGDHIIQNLPKELEQNNLKTIISSYVSITLEDLGIPVSGPAAYLSDGTVVTLAHVTGAPSAGDKQVSHWDSNGKLLFQYLIHSANDFTSEDRGFSFKSSNGIDLVGLGESDGPIIHLRSDSCESNHLGVFIDGRVSQTEELTAFITFKNDLVLFNSTSPCQSDADADRAYERLSFPNNEATTPADNPLVVNCSVLTFDDDLPIGPCSESYGVSMIQNALISYGYQIEPDGQYGQATADAVAQFQGVKGLTVTGTVDALTYAALGPLGVGTDLNGDGVVGPNETIGD